MALTVVLANRGKPRRFADVGKGHMHSSGNGRGKPAALSLLASERPRNVGWKQAAGLLFGDWGTSRLYVLGLAFFFAQRSSLYLICAMSGLILAVGWGYSQICRIYPDGGGVYTAAKHRNQMLAVVGALLLFADYVVTASLSSLDAFRYFNLPQGGSTAFTLFAWFVGNRFNRSDRGVQSDGPAPYRSICAGRRRGHGHHHAADHLRRAAAGELA